MACTYGDRGVPGPVGPIGFSPSDPLTPGKAASPGQLKRQLVNQTGFLPAKVPSTWVEAAIHDAELSMINRRYELATSELDWVLTVLRSAAADDVGEANSNRLAQVRALALLQSIASGIDIFGRNLNYVPLTSFEFSNSLVRSQLDYMDRIESASAILRAVERSQDEQIAATRLAATTLNLFVGESQQETVRIGQRCNRLQDEVIDLFADMKVQYEELQRAARSFKDALEEDAGCGFGDVIRFVSMVATVVSTVGAAAGALGAIGTATTKFAAWDSLAVDNPTWQNLTTDFEKMGKITKPLGSAVSGFRKSFKEAKDAIEEAFPDRSTFPQLVDVRDDHVKLVALKSDFDKAIEPYLNLPQARRYRDLMHRYIATAETRNNKIIEHDNSIRQIAELRARIEFERARVQVLATTTLQNLDTRRRGNLAFLDAGLTSLKWGLLRQLVGMERSLSFLSGETVETSFNDFSVAGLQVTATRLLQNYASAQEALGQSAQRARFFYVPLADILDQASMEALLAGEPVVFALDPNDNDPFEGNYAVQSASVAVASKNGEAIAGGEINLVIQHLGRSVVRNRDGNLHVYTHVPVTANYRQNSIGQIQSEGQLLETGGPSRFVGVSPYGPWRIRLLGASSAVRRNLRRASIAFAVDFRTLPIGTADELRTASASRAQTYDRFRQRYKSVAVV